MARFDHDRKLEDDPSTSGNMPRRRFLIGSATGLFTLGLAGCRENHDMSDELWRQWQSDWRRMEETARRRGWDVTPLAIAPPALEAAVLALEIRYGMKVPAQLREVLMRYSAHVAFGWSIPAHLHPLDRQNLPTMSANRDAIWDIHHIAERAIPNFLNWKKHLADRDLFEAPNGPEMWEHQFPIYELVNGDMLT